MPTFAIKNGNDLLTDMNSLLPDNSTQEISPLDHRTVQGQAICSAINKLDNKPLLGVKNYDNTRAITPTLAYEAGELAMQAGVIYQANIDIPLAQAFTPANWTDLTPSQSANNGLNVSGGNVKMGGTIISPTNVSGISNTNFLRFNTTDGRVGIAETITLNVNNTVGVGDFPVPAAGLVTGLKIDMSGYNTESRGLDVAVTGQSDLSIAGKFLAQLANDEGIAGYFDAANSVNHNRALVTDRGNIGFNWTDFDFGVTTALINVKSLDDTSLNSALRIFDTTGAIETHSFRNDGSVYHKRNLIVGESDVATAGNIAFAGRIANEQGLVKAFRVDTGTTSDGNTIVQMNNDKTMGFAGAYNPGRPGTMQFIGHVNVGMQNTTNFSIFATGNTSRLNIYTVNSTTNASGWMFQAAKANGAEPVSINEFRIGKGFAASGGNLRYIDFKDETSTTGLGAYQYIEFRKNLVIGRATSTASSAVSRSASIQLEDTDKAIILNKLTTTQRNALTAVNGMVIYNVTTNRKETYENGGWVFYTSNAA